MYVVVDGHAEQLLDGSYPSKWAWEQCQKPGFHYVLGHLRVICRITVLSCLICTVRSDKMNSEIPPGSSIIPSFNKKVDD